MDLTRTFVWTFATIHWPVSRLRVPPWHCNNFYRVSQFIWQGFQVVSSSFRISRSSIVLHVFHENQLSGGQWVALDCQYRAQNSVENNVPMLDCSNRVVGCRGRCGKLMPRAIVFADTTSCSVSILYLTIRKPLRSCRPMLVNNSRRGMWTKSMPAIESKLPLSAIDSYKNDRRRFPWSVLQNV